MKKDWKEMHPNINMLFSGLLDCRSFDIFPVFPYSLNFIQIM